MPQEILDNMAGLTTRGTTWLVQSADWVYLVDALTAEKAFEAVVTLHQPRHFGAITSLECNPELGNEVVYMSSEAQLKRLGRWKD